MEYRTAQQAAERLRVSVGRIKNLIPILYEKLGISKKAEIARCVF